ncbi:hypothetical protein HF888_10540 [Bermanella marisrubri]|uniref:Uncharacterized protein n=1 Tax=Bermanella marisrubri TaxID=207949 RepID=Q1N5S6_9GAMM|nr:hypothetical protein RED65_10749 [Oceanobacter sp. RED65] [Bermanella marisrubri]QIZ84626.1 hypothetical protein HF888_10540 [Bermanella marisrubri]
MLRWSNILFIVALPTLVISVWAGFRLEDQLAIAWLIVCHIVPVISMLLIKIAYILRLVAISEYM